MTAQFAPNSLFLMETSDYWYVFNTSVVRRIYRSHLAWDEIAKAEAVKDDRPFWENWTGNPDVVEVDWKSSPSEMLDERANQLTRQFFNQYANRYGGVVLDATRELKRLVNETSSRQDHFRKVSKDAASENKRNLNETLAKVDASVLALNVVRDMSATILLGLPLIPTSLLASVAGGAVVSSVMGGAVITGIANWQDNVADSQGVLLPQGRRLSGAVMAGSGALIFSLVGGPRKLIPGASDTVMLILQAVWDGSVALIGGREVSEAAIKGALTFTDPVLEKVLHSKNLEGLLHEYAVPFYVRLLKEDERVKADTMRIIRKAQLGQVVQHGVSKLGDVLGSNDGTAAPIARTLRREARGALGSAVESAFYAVHKKTEPFHAIPE